MKRLFYILLIIIGVFIMLKPIDAIIKDSISNIVYRGNVVTGIIATDNGNGSYDVFISESDKAYPKIFTLSANPNLAVGDKVRILYEGGCREKPIIWPPTISAIKNIYVVYKKLSDSKYYLVKINSDDSITPITELPELITGNDPSLVRILTENSGNVYALKQNENPFPAPFDHTLYKYNSSGILQITKVLAEGEMFGFIAIDGFLYTMIFNDDKIRKRNLSDLETIDIINLTGGHRYYYLCFDNDGYLYTYDRDFAGGAAFVKWDLGIAVIASHIQGLGSLSAWADWSLLGDNIACEYDPIWTINITLDSDFVNWILNDIPNSQAIGSGVNQNYRYVIGENTADNKLIVEKYNAAKILQTTIDISTDYISGGYRRFHNAITAYPF